MPLFNKGRKVLTDNSMMKSLMDIQEKLMQEKISKRQKDPSLTYKLLDIDVPVEQTVTAVKPTGRGAEKKIVPDDPKKNIFRLKEEVEEPLNPSLKRAMGKDKEDPELKGARDIMPAPAKFFTPESRSYKAGLAKGLEKSGVELDLDFGNYVQFGGGPPKDVSGETFQNLFISPRLSYKKSTEKGAGPVQNKAQSTGNIYEGKALTDDDLRQNYKTNTGEKKAPSKAQINLLQPEKFKIRVGESFGTLDHPIVTVEQGPKHFYSFDMQVVGPVIMQKIKKDVQPNLRPSTIGKINLGDVVGEIQIGKKTHPIYNKIEIDSTDSMPQDMQPVPKFHKGGDAFHAKDDTPHTHYINEDGVLSYIDKPNLPKSSTDFGNVEFESEVVPSFYTTALGRLGFKPDIDVLSRVDAFTTGLSNRTLADADGGIRIAGNPPMGAYYPNKDKLVAVQSPVLNKRVKDRFEITNPYEAEEPNPEAKTAYMLTKENPVIEHESIHRGTEILADYYKDKKDYIEKKYGPNTVTVLYTLMDTNKFRQLGVEAISEMVDAVRSGASDPASTYINRMMKEEKNFLNDMRDTEMEQREYLRNIFNIIVDELPNLEELAKERLYDRNPKGGPTRDARGLAEGSLDKNFYENLKVQKKEEAPKEEPSFLDKQVEKFKDYLDKRKKRKAGEKMPAEFNQGGTAMKDQMQMAFMNEGGMKDDGGETEPTSGNKVPSGSLKEEVADDIPAMLSEGEFVFPADVVRYIGLETLMKMRQDAKQGLKMMEKMGQLGNPEEAELPDDIPFGMADLVVVSGEMKKEDDEKEEKAEGGAVGLANGGGLFDDPRFQTATTGQPDPTVYTPEEAQEIKGALGQPMQPSDIQIKKIINPNNPDDFMMWQFDKEGNPMYPLPEGYVVDDTPIEDSYSNIISRREQPTESDSGDSDRMADSRDSTGMTLPKESDFVDSDQYKKGQYALFSRGKPIRLQETTLDNLSMEYERIKELDGMEKLTFQDYYNLPSYDKARFSLGMTLGREPTATEINAAIQQAKKSPTGLLSFLNPVVGAIKSFLSPDASGGFTDKEYRKQREKRDVAVRNLTNLIDPRSQSPYGDAKGVVSEADYQKYKRDTELQSQAMLPSTGKVGKVDDFLLGVRRDPTGKKPPTIFKGNRNPDGSPKYEPLTTDALGRIEKNRQDVANTALERHMKETEQFRGDILQRAEESAGQGDLATVAQNEAFDQQMREAQDIARGTPRSGGSGGSGGSSSQFGASNLGYGPSIGYGGGAGESFGPTGGFYVGGVATKPMKPQRLRKGGIASPKAKPKKMKKGGLASSRKK